MESVVLEGVRRTKIGTRYARRARAAGQLPAIVYGHGEEPESIALPAHEVVEELHHGTRVLGVKLEGTEYRYLIKAVQYNYLGTMPIHLDLMRVNVDEVVTVQVSIELRGKPKGVSDGGVLEQHLMELEVECTVAQIPATLRPSVVRLELGASLTVGDLDLPDGVKSAAPADERVATVKLPTEEVEEEEPAEEGATQPEMIGRGKKDDEESAEGGK